MGKRGPAPKPIALKRLQGTRRADRDSDIDLLISDKKPTCPSFLTRQAKAEWKRIAGPLHDAGLLKWVDRAALSAYCQAYGRWVEAEKALDESIELSSGHGLVYRNHNGNHTQNPLVPIARMAREEVRKAAASFGMTPSSRSRIVVGDGGKVEVDELEQLFMNKNRQTTRVT